MDSKDIQNREQSLNELREAYQFYLAGFEKGYIYNLLDTSAKPTVEEMDITEAKSILGKFTISGKLA